MEGPLCRQLSAVRALVTSRRFLRAREVLPQPFRLGFEQTGNVVPPTPDVSDQAFCSICP